MAIHPADPHAEVPKEDFEDLYENAPCGYLSIHSNGRIAQVNRTLAIWDRAGL